MGDRRAALRLAHRADSITETGGTARAALGQSPPLPPPGAVGALGGGAHYFTDKEVYMSTTTEATILLAEEDDVTRAFLHDNLSADGYQVLVAPDRAKALALLRPRTRT